MESFASAHAFASSSLPPLSTSFASIGDAASGINSYPISPHSAGTTPQRPMSAMVRPAPRSNSRMSVGSKAGGSRASDDEARTSVKVGTYFRPPFCLLLGSHARSRGFSSTDISSRSRAPASEAHRSRLRPYPPTIPTVHGPSDVQHEPVHRLTTRPKTLCLRPCLRPRCDTGWCLGVSDRLRQRIYHRLQCFPSGLWPVWRWKVVHHGHIWTDGARRFRGYG